MNLLKIKEKIIKENVPVWQYAIAKELGLQTLMIIIRWIDKMYFLWITRNSGWNWDMEISFRARMKQLKNDGIIQ